MKLTSFRITKYKRIDDTDWIDVGDFNGFIGKNEVGKSSLFKALSKINPSDGKGFTKIDEIPHQEFRELETKDDITFVSAVFESEEGDGDIGVGIPQKFTLSRDYNDKYSLSLDSEDAEFEGRFTVEDALKIIPKFIYFDKYDLLEGKIDLREFVEKQREDPDSRELRIKRCLFDYVKLKPEDLDSLNPNESDPNERNANMRKRKMLCNDAAKTITKEFNRWWPHGKYEIMYSIDGNMFQVYVSDSDDSTEVELHNRSSGLQYFLSFFTIFLVESVGNHTNAVLLLDEPGLHYHGTLQLEMIKFFRKLSKNNQFFYTTHSPFLVDPKDYDSVKIVHIDENGRTQVGEKGTGIVDYTSIFPLQINWYHSQFQNYVKNKFHIIVEGETDVMIFEAINEIMKEKELEYIDDSAMFISGMGDKTNLLVHLLKQHKIDMMYFFDGDDAGINRGKKLERGFGIKGALTNKYIKNGSSSIEDIFPEKLYLEAFSQVHRDIILDEYENKTGMITKRLESTLNGKEEYDKIEVTKELLKSLKKDPEPILEQFKPIFSDIVKIRKSILDSKSPTNQESETKQS